MAKSWLKRFWRWSGLDVESFLFIMKVAAPPVIALSLYQNRPTADIHDTLGYFLPLSTLLACGTLPRAKFIHNMLISLFALSLSGAINMLALFTGVQARTHVMEDSSTDFNSSQASVCATWLVLQIYAASYYKSAYPQYTYAVLSYEIVAIVAMISGSQYTMMTEATAFIRTTLVTFLTGFAITCGMSLLIWPISCRTIAFDDMAKCLKAIRNVSNAQLDYMTSVEDSDMFHTAHVPIMELTRAQSARKALSVDTANSKLHNPNLQAEKLKRATNMLIAAQAKLAGDIVFAKRDFGWGTMNPDEMNQVTKLLNDVIKPLIGLSSIIDILDRVARMHGWKDDCSAMTESDLELVRQQTVVVKEWQTVMKKLHGPFHDMTEAMYRANNHIMLVLSLDKPRKRWLGKTNHHDLGSDVEATKQSEVTDFAAEFERAIQMFFAGRKSMIEEWCKEQGVDLSKTPSFESLHDTVQGDRFSHKQRENHIQLLVLLYMRQLLRSTSQNLLILVRYVDQKANDGILSKNRWILPGSKRLKKMIRPSQNLRGSDHVSIHKLEKKRTSLDEALYTRKDPEHLPPANHFQRLGNLLRIIPRKLRSGHSAFGFRVACAVMSLAILGFLRSTQAFFLAQRATWAVIMIVFSMSRTAGASTFHFFYRCAGTILSLIACFTSYYIANGNSSGTLIILYIWMIIFHWVMVKKSKYTSVGIISAMTTVVILGYVFEEKVLGELIQPHYPPYLVGPYRFLCVIVGVTVAFIWTVFPYPITERSEVRHGTATLLHLLAKYYTISRAISLARIQGLEGDISLKNSPGWLLDKARQKTLSKSQIIISQLKVNSDMIKWQLSVGGAFPKQTYAALLEAAERFLRNTTLLADASLAFSEPGDPAQAEWLRDLRILVSSVQESLNDVASVLLVLSASVASGEPLPPFLRMPEPFILTERLKAMDPETLGVAHLAEPGHAAIAVIQLASTAIEADLEVLVREVKNLVGELDFSLRTVTRSAGINVHKRSHVPGHGISTKTTIRHRGQVGGGGSASG